MKGQGAAPTGAGAGGTEQETLDGAALNRGRVGLRLPVPCCRALTEAVHAPAFELALKGHVITAGEDADAIELALHKLPLVPAQEELLRQQLPMASWDAQGECMQGCHAHLEPSEKVRTPQPWKRPFSKCPT